MSRLNLILVPSLLALTLPGWAAAGTKGRPLNLSLPRDVLHAPGSKPVDETVERNLRAPAPSREANTPAQPVPLPYGAGYEHRHQEIGGAGGSAGAGGGGAGRQGR